MTRTCEALDCDRELPMDDESGRPAFINEYEQGRYSLAVCGIHWDPPLSGAALQAASYL